MAGLRHKVTVVGSGNWGCTIAKIVAENTKEHNDLFEEDVQMWVYEEDVVIPKTSAHYDESIGDAPQKLTHVLNKYHENVKYLPGIKLPANLIANPSLEDAVKDSSILIFNLPHQFISRVCGQLKGKIVPWARGISCIKGVHVSDEGVSLFSEWIGDGLGIYCGALSGANIASQIAEEKLSDTTIAYDPPPVDTSRGPTPRGGSPTGSSVDLTELRHRDARGRLSTIKLAPVPAEYAPLDHKTFKTLFRRPYFRVNVVSDVAGVSLGGALKNIVALAAGATIGRGHTENTKSMIMRVGMNEMIRFGVEFFKETVVEHTFIHESAGYPDLIVSSASGRNYRCARMAVAEGVNVAEIEARELNGQKLQGTSTAEEVYDFLKAKGQVKDYPLFTAVRDFVVGDINVDEMLDRIPFD